MNNFHIDSYTKCVHVCYGYQLEPSPQVDSNRNTKHMLYLRTVGNSMARAYLFNVGLKTEIFQHPVLNPWCAKHNNG